MRKTLLFIALMASVGLYAQVQPVVHNSNFDKIAKSSGSDASSAGWIQKDLGDQAETSTLDVGHAIKFDDIEADAMYQEVAVVPNSDYMLTFEYSMEDKGTDDTLSSLEVRVLSGLGYAMGYTTLYPLPATVEQSDLGYKDIADVENAANNLADTTIVYPGDDVYRTAVVYFSTGSESSIALFARGVGRDSIPVDGKSYNWSNGSCEVRIDSLSLENITLEMEPVVHNSNFDKIPKSSGSDASSAGWIQKDLGDQAETSTLDVGHAVKFDDIEADAIYQEVAVQTNMDYMLTFEYSMEDKGTDDTLSSLEVRVLSEFGYAMGYTPTFADPATVAQSDLGYKDIADVEDDANNLTDTTIVYPGDDAYRTAVIYFNSGSKTSVAIFARGVGRDSIPVDGKNYNWSNGSCEVRIDSLSLTNLGFNHILDTNATLKDLQVDGTTVEGFDAEELSYDVELMVGTTDVPKVTVTTTAYTSLPLVTPASSLPGTTTVLVTAEDGTALTYSVVFTVALNDDATLSDLQVDLTTVDGFDADLYSYDVELDAGTTIVPTVTATTTASASDDPVVTPAASLPGTTTVLVTAEDGTTQTYSVVFTVALSDDATLSDLQVDATTVAGFDADLYSYDVELDAGTTVVPTVTATATASTSDAPVVTPAASLPGTTTVLVTAEDGTTQTYSVVFTVSTTSVISKLNNLDISIYAYNNILHVQSPDELLNGSVNVYNLLGKLVVSHTINSNSEEFSMKSNGLFIVAVSNSNNELVSTLKVFNK